MPLMVDVYKILLPMLSELVIPLIKPGYELSNKASTLRALMLDTVEHHYHMSKLHNSNVYFQHTVKHQLAA